MLCLALLVPGIFRLRGNHEATALQPAKSFLRVWVLAAAFASGMLLMYSVIEIRHSPVHKPTLKYVEAMTVLPFLIAAAAAMLQKLWNGLSNRHWCLNFLEGDRPLVLMMAFVPFLLLSTVSIVFRPIMDPRGLE